MRDSNGRAHKPAGEASGGEFAPQRRDEADVTLPEPSDYRAPHTAPRRDGYSSALHETLARFPEDVLDHVDWYSSDLDEEALRQLLAANGNPDAEVTLYRAVPNGVDTISPGDWVSLSRAYAAQHAIQDDDPDHDWPVIEMRAPARHVWNDGNDLNEFGFDPD